MEAFLQQVLQNQQQLQQQIQQQVQQQAELQQRNQQEIAQVLREVAAGRSRGHHSLVDVKGIGKPENLDGAVALDRVRFVTWKTKFCNWVCASIPEASEVFEGIDGDSQAEFTSERFDNMVADERPWMIGLSAQLNAALVSLCVGDPLAIVVHTTKGRQSGVEAYRRLVHRFDPSGPRSSKQLLQRLMTTKPVEISKVRSAVEELEKHFADYAVRAQQELPEELRIVILDQLLMDPLRTHITLNGDRLKTYDLVRAEVMLYAERIAQEARDATPTPMEIGNVDALQKGKGKAKGKGKGGKSKSSPNPNPAKLEGYCLKCGKWGHKRSQCWSGDNGKGEAVGAGGSGQGKPPKGKGKGKGKKGTLNEVDEANLVDTSAQVDQGGTVGTLFALGDSRMMLGTSSKKMARPKRLEERNPSRSASVDFDTVHPRESGRGTAGVAIDTAGLDEPERNWGSSSDNLWGISASGRRALLTHTSRAASSRAQALAETIASIPADNKHRREEAETMLNAKGALEEQAKVLKDELLDKRPTMSTRFRLDLAAGHSARLCYFKERSRKRAAAHRAGMLAERSTERKELDQAWHKRFDADSGPRAVGHHGLTKAAKQEFRQDSGEEELTPPKKRSWERPQWMKRRTEHARQKHKDRKRKRRAAKRKMERKEMRDGGKDDRDCFLSDGADSSVDDQDDSLIASLGGNGRPRLGVLVDSGACTSAIPTGWWSSDPDPLRDGDRKLSKQHLDKRFKQLGAGK